TALESLTPIAKLSNGFSVTLFAKRGGRLKTWSDIAAVSPLKVSTPMKEAPGYLAELMMEHSGLKTETTVRDGSRPIMDDVLSGRHRCLRLAQDRSCGRGLPDQGLRGSGRGRGHGRSSRSGGSSAGDQRPRRAGRHPQAQRGRVAAYPGLRL